MNALAPGVEPRIYQQVISATCYKHNTLVVLPTGLGKTLIALLVSLKFLSDKPNQKILFFAPTKPLVHQHMRTFTGIIQAPYRIETFTGSVSAQKRATLFNEANIIFSTPQGFENDVLASKVELTQISCIIFDEAHRASGDYSYTWIAQQFRKQQPKGRIIGLSASPGTDLESIEEVCTNLSIEKIEVRDTTSPDVSPYVHETHTRFIEVDLPASFITIQKPLRELYAALFSRLKNLGFLQGKQASQFTKKELLMFIGALQGKIAQGFDSTLASGISLSAQLLKLSHAIELFESQGVAPLYSYICELEDQAKRQASKAVVLLLQEQLMRTACAHIKEFHTQHVQHPKMDALVSLVNTILKKPDAKMLVFSQYRDTLLSISEELGKNPKVKSNVFVGQAKKKNSGLSQKEQLAMIKAFESGEYNVLCMSSVGEEGLDIPSVDAVIFYEPIPSAIRSIQRRGRTGRHTEGKVYVLVAKQTRDVAYRYISAKKERSMYTVLEEVKKKLHLSPGMYSLTAAMNQPVQEAVIEEAVVETANVEKSHAQKIRAEKPISMREVKSSQTLLTVPKSSISIYADHREKGSSVLKLLYEKDVELKLEQLILGDFVVSKDVVVEYKRVPDFVDSLLDGRLLSQLKRLKEGVLHPLIIVEGEESIFSIRQVHPNAIYGMLATIAVSYGIPLLWTKTSAETADLLVLLARRGQLGSTSWYTPHAQKPQDTNEQLLFIVSAFPHIGMATATKLLERFGSLFALFSATVDELSSVDGISANRAQEIHDLLRVRFRKEKL